MAALETAALWLARVCAVLLFGLFALTLSQVVLRKAGQPLVWSNDVSALLLIWASLLGAVALQARDGHVRIEFLLSALAPRAARLMRAAGNLVIIALLVAVLVASPSVLKSAATTFPTTLPISLFWYRLATVAMALACIVIVAVQTVQLVLPADREPETRAP